MPIPGRFYLAKKPAIIKAGFCIHGTGRSFKAKQNTFRGCQP